MKIYVQQFDGFWSLSLDSWKRAVAEVCWGKGTIEYRDFGRELRSQPGSVHKSENGDYYCSAPSELFRLVSPLDWSDDDWLAEADDLGLKAPKDRSGEARDPNTPRGGRGSQPITKPGQQQAYARSGDTVRSLGLRMDGQSMPSHLLPLDNPHESYEDAERRIKGRFAALSNNAKKLIDGDIPAIIVSGPPGIGKSYEFQTRLKDSTRINWMEVEDHESASQYPEEWAGDENSAGFYDTISGSMSAPGLYRALWNMRKNGVLLLDDVDDVFRNETSLNILKKALDTNPEQRVISWRKEARWLEESGIPNSFRFEGQIVFLTNIDFELVIKKGGAMAEHMKALMDRSRYLSLTLRTLRDFMIHIRNVAGGDTGMLVTEHGLAKDDAETVLQFIDDHKTHFYNLSLRLVGQVAQELKIDPNNWRENIEATKMRTI